jgi:hypothetical protein
LRRGLGFRRWGEVMDGLQRSRARGGFQPGRRR